MLAADGTGVGEENANHHFIGWVFLDAAQEAGVLAESYEKRVHAYARHRADKKTQRHAEGMALGCPVRSPLWNDGVNHVMIDFGDDGM